mmetsp:Transcript_33940/g.87142  ORF Transcript_33940/g.87142 Transcript_33940/m.87142 type:complete len:85 (+) Transcript_33940:218-472(+)
MEVIAGMNSPHIFAFVLIQGDDITHHISRVTKRCGRGVYRCGWRHCRDAFDTTSLQVQYSQDEQLLTMSAALHASGGGYMFMIW